MQATRPTLDTVGGEEEQIFGFERILIFCDQSSTLWFRFASQCRIVDTQKFVFDQSQIGRHLIAAFHFDEIANHQMIGSDLFPFAISDHDRRFGHQILEGVHYFVGFPLLVVGEVAGHEDDERKHNA